jgi:cysteinyl-tRNA synthetase
MRAARAQIERRLASLGPRSARRRPSALLRRCGLGLAMLASTAAGAALTLLLTWSAPQSVIVAAPEPEMTTASIAPKAVPLSPGSHVPSAPIETPPMSAAMPPPAAIQSWRYQLQNIDPASIARSSADLVVVDYASGERPFSPAQVEAMKRKGDGARRLVLAYLSIGEAEEYRFYWQREWRAQPPAWLGAENPKWPRNHAVKFWDAEWQAIVFDYAARIVQAGFDGVYLDRVDGFESMGRATSMVDFVARLSSRVKAQRPGFLVVPQNGDALIADARFRGAIDAFAREDLFYGEDKDGARNKPASVRESLARLKRLAADGKPVLVVEYPRDEAQGQAVVREIAAQGFIGLAARRELDRL